MSLGNKASSVPTGVAPGVKPANTTKGKTQAAEEIAKNASEILASKTSEERAQLGNLSHTLHFINQLGLESQNSPRKVGPNENIDCATPVGVVLKTDVDIKVPQISIEKNNKTGIDPETDIEYKDIKAGETFELTLYEFMFLIIRDEYTSYLTHESNPKGAYFSAKFPQFFKGDAKLPTPTINLAEGSSKENIVAVDKKGQDGKWTIKEQYARYAPLLKSSTPKRAGGKTSTAIPRPVQTALALQKILGVKKA